MPSTALIVLAIAAGLLVLAFWGIRRSNLAVVPAGRAPRELRPLPTGCDLGATLLLAASDSGEISTPGGGTAPAPGATGSAPTAKPPAAAATKPAAPPKRNVVAGPSRREFLRNSWLLAWLFTLGGFGATSIAFLWPTLRGGFGAQITLPDSEDAILAQIAETGEPYAFPSGRLYLVEYDAALDPDGEYAAITGEGSARVMAIYQRCVHLGCRVPWCLSSQWFECPCHGSRYNRWGEYEFGPAPRGLDRFGLTVEDGLVTVDTALVVDGPTRTVKVLPQAPEGPHCN